MTKARQSRARRRKLRAHDRGENRHNKTLAHSLKLARKGADFSVRASLRKRAAKARKV